MTVWARADPDPARGSCHSCGVLPALRRHELRDLLPALRRHELSDLFHGLNLRTSYPHSADMN